MQITENPYIATEEDGREIADAETIDAMLDGAKFMVGNGEYERLFVRPRHSGSSVTVERDDHGDVVIRTVQGRIRGWQEGAR